MNTPQAGARTITGRKILLCTYGTRGDVEPILALALGLQRAGFDVLLATSERFQRWIEQHGVRAFAMSDASLAQIESADGRAMLEGGHLLKRICAGIRLYQKSGPINDTLMRQTWAAAQAFSPDLIVYHAKLFAAPHVAEALKVPAVMATLQPVVVPTAAFPAMGLPRLKLPGYNRWSYRLVRRSFGVFRKAINRFRRTHLGLGPVSTARHVLFPPGAGLIPVLHAYSQHVIPRPADWPASAHTTGYWRLGDHANYTPDPALDAFLSAGPAPVFVGFGSMTSVDPKSLGALVIGALRKAGQRGIIAKGWADLEIAAADDIIGIEATPYAWLFPRMAAVVHHGGAGTTAEGFYAGAPCVICPFFGDQPGWADVSVKLGVGAGPVPRRTLTVDRLATAIEEAVASARHRAHARRLAEALHAEDGVGNAVSLICDRIDAETGATHTD